MQDYVMKIELKTETLFGNGDAITGFLDADVHTDEYGLPFLKAKTLKGLLRENMELIAFNKAGFEERTLKLFGNETIEGLLRVSNASLSDTVQDAVKRAIEEQKMSSDELKRAITTEYTYTKMENGVATDHSLRTFRMLRKNLVFYADVSIADVDEEENTINEACLGAAVALLKHVGTLKSKGKGVVSCSLWKNGIAIQEDCVKAVMKERAR